MYLEIVLGLRSQVSGYGWRRYGAGRRAEILMCNFFEFLNASAPEILIYW
jgi:hypothetical protein